jgi:hypothetical protein
MKTNNLTKRSFLMSMVLFATALFTANKSNNFQSQSSGIHYGNAIYIPRRSKFKGYMRENRRSTFNKNK